MNLLSPTIAARVLGVTLDGCDVRDAEDAFGNFELAHRLEYAARTRAVERWPLATRRDAVALPCGAEVYRLLPRADGSPHQDDPSEESLGAPAVRYPAQLEATDGLDAMIVRDLRAIGLSSAMVGSWSPADNYDMASLTLTDEDADRLTGLLRGEPNDSGTDGCPPAAVRHVCAGALVASLVSGTGFPYGDPPLLPAGAGPVRPVEATAREARTYIAHLRMGEELPPERGRYEIAEDVLEYLLGVSSTRDPEAPTNEQTPEAIHEAAIDLAIALLCDEAHSVAAIAAGAAAWLLATHRGAWATARARRICSVVGVRFPREAGRVE